MSQEDKYTTNHYKLPYNFGLGGAPLGNGFDRVTDAEAYDTIEAAWNAGVRYFDVAPWYGLGLAERRFGQFLQNQNRDEYVVSSKVGRLLKASKKAANSTEKLFPLSPSPNEVIHDYSAAGVRRSIEDTLQRMGIDSLDIVFVHDLAPDNPRLEGGWLKHFEIAKEGAFPELTHMREEGLIRSWGLGVNTPEPILKTLEVADPDTCLLASQYSLIDHENALRNVFPAVRKNNVSLVMGSNLNAGFLSGRDRYNYGDTIPAGFLEKRTRMQEIAHTYDVDLRTAALQFALFPDVAVAIIPGARTPQQIVEDVNSMKAKIPTDFWAELKAEGLIASDAPVSKGEED